ncbi:hypothetical protein V1508DRAFT_445674 [Lipomyces doorenjongii]|uniref:uncharacterized protein n=1 Tax=Lipomyces doorenjongii TaxID=383834 RepID=UPI0034CE40C8
MASSSPALPEEDLFQHALDFLADNEPEQCLRAQLPLDKYEELQRHAESLYGEKKYPYVDYCSNTSTVIIYTAPSPLHGMFSASLQSELYRVARNELIRLNKPELARKLKAFGESSDRPIFGGYNSRISKVPDGGLIYRLDHENVLTVVIETGLSETYEKLQNDAKLWLDGSHCQMAIIVCLAEQPKFKYPKKSTYNASLAIYDDFRNTMACTSTKNPFGPYMCNGHAWFGKLDEAFAVVYKRDEDERTTKSEPYWLVRDGIFLVEDDTLDTGVTLGDIIPRDEAADADIRTEPVKFDTQDIRELLLAGAMQTAYVRFRALIGDE